MKRILITGANSYIGNSFQKYVEKHYGTELVADAVDMIDGTWEGKDFSPYDIVYHVAGIAHTDPGQLSEKEIAKYYEVNTELAIETAKKAKRERVKQFIFMSSSIIYGDSNPYSISKMITKETAPRPSNHYGRSKWQADQGIRALSSPTFTVTVLRPPMVYGKGSKGNYPLLSKLAKRLPVFPDIQNKRSMIYIENLCEFLCRVMIGGYGGVFWPQNAEYTRTSEMVRLIAEANGHKMIVTKAFNWVVFLSSHIPGKIGKLTNKAFGNMIYDQSMSKYDFDYTPIDFKTSIKETEAL